MAASESATRLVPISELGNVYPGYSPRPEERKQRGKYLLIGGRNIKDARLVTTDKDTYIDNVEKDAFRRAIAVPGDIIVSTLFETRKLYIYRDSDPRGVVNNSCAIITASDNNDYIVSYLRTLEGKDQFLRDASAVTAGAFIPRVSVSDLARIEIPLLPLTELQRLGDEHIESSSSEELISLRKELHSKDAEIGDLRANLNSLLGADEESRRLRAELMTITAYYEDRIRKVEEQISHDDLKVRISHGETVTLEFKSSLRWNARANRNDEAMELAVLKTVAAFCNSSGGELLIGVSDDRLIVGIGADRFPNEDKFLLHLRNLLTDRLVPSVIGNVEYNIVELDDKRICHIVCKQSPVDVWLKANRKCAGDVLRAIWAFVVSPRATRRGPLYPGAFSKDARVKTSRRNPE